MKNLDRYVDARIFKSYTESFLSQGNVFNISNFVRQEARKGETFTFSQAQIESDNYISLALPERTIGRLITKVEFYFKLINLSNPDSTLYVEFSVGNTEEVKEVENLTEKVGQTVAQVFTSEEIAVIGHTGDDKRLITDNKVFESRFSIEEGIEVANFVAHITVI